MTEQQANLEKALAKLDQTAEPEQKKRQQQEILYAQADNFMTLHLIDLLEDTNYEFKSFSTARQYSGRRDNTARQLQEAMAHLAIGPTKERILRFADLSTLADRMQQQTTIAEEFEGKAGWMTLAFTALDYTPDGKLWHVVITAHTINEAKRQEANLVRRARIDSWTGLYNRYAYEEDLERLETELAEGKMNELAFVSVGARGQNKIAASATEKAEEHLLEVVSFCLFAVFCNDGACYRLGGDEFMVILRVGEERLQQLLEEFEQQIRSSAEERKEEIHPSLAAAGRWEHQELTAEALAGLAEIKRKQI